MTLTTPLSAAKVNFKAKWVHHAKKEGRHRINICIPHRPEKVKEFIRVLEEALPCPANTSVQLRDGNNSEIPATMLLC